MAREVFETINVIPALDYVLDTTRKRHIASGLLISLALLFGGFALTVLTIKNDGGAYDE
jgi:hypothetical protein